LARASTTCGTADLASAIYSGWLLWLACADAPLYAVGRFGAWGGLYVRPAQLLTLLLIVLAVVYPEIARSCALDAHQTRTVTAVLDGETLALDDGSEVRLTGSLAPKQPTGRDGFWPDAQKAQGALELLVLGRTIDLKVAGRTRDRYGRLLAHAFVLDGGQQVWVQGAMVSAGHAQAYALPENAACIAELLALERIAREAKLGLWASAAYAVRDALRPGDIAKLAGSFAIVEGKVIRAAQVGATLYLNFGSDWRRDFTVAVPKRLFKKAAPVAYEGLEVRVRGWVQRRNGPLIEVSTLEDIELRDGAATERASRPNGP
jgi:micrococcal nuclease